MAYFSNGSEGDRYQAEYCERCVHGANNQPCPVLGLHYEWNYEAVGENGDAAKRYALNTLWPMQDGFPAQCLMFTPAILPAVVAEMERARATFPDADGLVAALGEEVGELCKALLEEPRERVEAEAVQVAAVALRLAEEGDPTLKAIRDERVRETAAHQSTVERLWWARRRWQNALGALAAMTAVVVDHLDPLWTVTPENAQKVAILKKVLARVRPEEETDVRRCRVCGCTDNDCSGCIERTGEPCHWVARDLCSACAETRTVEAEI